MSEEDKSEFPAGAGFAFAVILSTIIWWLFQQR